MGYVLQEKQRQEAMRNEEERSKRSEMMGKQRAEVSTHLTHPLEMLFPMSGWYSSYWSEIRSETRGLLPDVINQQVFLYCSESLMSS